MQGGVKRPPLLCKGSIDIIDGADLIPIDFGGRLAPPLLPINELGRRLLKASADGNIEEIKFLMNKGAPFTADWLGTSPLHFAAQNNFVDICDLLLHAGISKDARTKVDRTPLHIAAAEGHLEIIKCLLRYKADIECRDLLEMTPLHWAVQNCHVEVVSFLISEGAQIDVINKFGLTPMEISVQCERYDIVEMLKSRVRDPMIAAQNLSIHLDDIENSCDSFSNVPDTQQVISPFLENVDLDDSENDTKIEFRDPLDEASDDEHHQDYANNDDILEAQPHNIKLQIPEDTNRYIESLRLLQQHGITMLPADDTNILSSVLEFGRSVVLTDIGKEVLNSTKPIEAVVTKPTKIHTFPVNQKIITVSADQFLEMTNNQNKIKLVNGKLLETQQPQQKPSIKRIIMKKNKVLPFANKVTKIFTTKHDNIMDIKMLVKQLADAKSLAEEYKQKYLKKYEEAEQYKQQILMLTRNKS